MKILLNRFLAADPHGGGGGGTTSGVDPDGYTIGVNTETVQSTIDTIATESSKVSAAIDKIFRLIDDGFGDSWSGESYEAFKVKCHTYEGPVKGIVTFLNAYNELLEGAKGNAETLTKSVSDSIE